MASDTSRIVLTAIAIFFFVTTVALVIAFSVVYTSNKESPADQNSASLPVSDRVSSRCPADGQIIPNDIQNPSLFDDLSALEIEKVESYMLYRSKLGIVRYERATLSQSYIFLIELHVPAKYDVLRYLDSGDSKPKRNAKVTVFHGDLSTPEVREYLVGPLPNPSRHEQLNQYPKLKKGVPFYNRPIDSKEIAEIREKVVVPVMSRLRHILNESFGATFGDDCGSRCLRFGFIYPSTTTKGVRKNWFWFMYAVETESLHPVALQMLVNHDSRSSNGWFIEKVWYNGVVLESTSELIFKYNNFYIPKIKQKFPTDAADFSYASKGSSSHTKHKIPPRMFEPQGRRYSVKGQEVSYMKWTFAYRTKPSTGLQLFNIKYDGTRIAYEISLQQIAMIYSGRNPIQMMASYFQATELIGLSNFELVPGYDCPEHATFLNVTQYANGKPILYKNAICIFETSSGTPLSRHYAANDQKNGFQYYAGEMDYYLVVRTITSIYISDYIQDYVFHTNGVLEIKNSLTGCLKTSIFHQSEMPYGYEIMPNIVSTIYNYLANFKIDLDILGTNNSLETTRIFGYIDKHPFTDTNHIYFRSQARMEHTIRKTEKQAAFGDSSFPDYTVFTSDKRTRSDNKRGYRLKIGSSSSLKLVDDLSAGVSAENGAEWARYKLAVTRYKSTEDCSSSIYTGVNPYEPVIDFKDYISDNENIVEQDLVAWVTVGSHRIPSLEDIPSISTVGEELKIVLTPYNYFDKNPSSTSPDAIHFRESESPKTIGYKLENNLQCIRDTGPFKYDGRRTPAN